MNTTITLKEAKARWSAHTLTQRLEATDYGINEIGVPYRDQDGSWFRLDCFTSNPGTRSALSAFERRFAAGKDDYSPLARPMYAGKGNCSYHSKCSCCWLGFSHTLALHEREAVGSFGGAQ